jgi:hypothetical protein
MVVAVYTLPGCDTVAHPSKIGEKKTLKVALANTEVLGPLASYGDANLMPISAVENAARLLYCALYGRKDFVGI